ncbi:Uncharacterised protein [Vibrio cholerae]|nr:Uncharacterised protein [Vibrio cholerae]
MTVRYQPTSNTIFLMRTKATKRALTTSISSIWVSLT